MTKVETLGAVILIATIWFFIWVGKSTIEDHRQKNNAEQNWPVIQEAKDAKEETNNQAAKAAAEPAASTVPVTLADKQSSSDDDGELIAVISAAIAAISESANVQILSVRSGGNGWVLAGRQDLMSKL